MQNLISVAEKQAAQLRAEVTKLESELEAKQAILAKLDGLIGELGGKAPAKKRGRKPGKVRPAVVAGKRGPRPGRKPAGEDTLPTLIVKVIKGGGAPMNAREIHDGLRKIGWETSSADPQAMVYKTLHRIEKMGLVAKAARGRFTLP